MQPTQELVDAIYWDKVLAARRMSVDEKLVGGILLFQQVTERMRDGIRMQNPAATAEEVEEILIARLRLLRRIEEASWTKSDTSTK